MSMTKYMHPRNIYKTPPDFKQLAIDFPEFRKHVKQELSGKVSLDFKNLEALRSLTCTLLKRDFDLDVQIPLNKLIPTIPLRLNYILWIEDLMEISRNLETDNMEIKGIDIGTGASCVYSLICASKNHWFMLATDIDVDSINYAKQNVSRNSLDSYVQVKKVENTKLFAIDGHNINKWDFSMCNPPFFSNQQETIFEFKSRKMSRPRPKNAFCAASQEVVAQGGEIEFITKMIKESQQLQTVIRIYTTMIGHASSLSPLKKLLREVDVVSFKQTEFCQGNTTRWGLAWTFCNIDLRKVPETTLAAQRKLKQHQKNSFQYQITNIPAKVSLNDVHLKLLALFEELELSCEVKPNKLMIMYEIEGNKCTWLHQRRKRRAAQRSNSITTSTEEFIVTDAAGIETLRNNEDLEVKSKCIENTTDMLAQMDVKSPKKRELENEEGYYNNKRFKGDTNVNVIVKNDLLLSARVNLFKDASTVNIELVWKDGTENRDVLHQILQYLKNRLKL